ncbi:nuclease-related domain-containing protein [Clostridium perfringens]|uniref:nuclease-related domain-containing protein n=1 Tax=Clostridium perfringens TaxID=1502 RepID=UPI0024BC9C5C|nr:nuclease-related domain-containing protein [Clostridium perfringens]
MMYSNRKNNKFKNFQEGLVTAFKSLFTNSNKQNISEDNNEKDISIELKERGILFAKNYLNVSINTEESFDFVAGYKATTSKDFKFCTLSEKVDYFKSLQDANLANKLENIIEVYKRAYYKITKISTTDIETNFILNNITKSLEEFIKLFEDRLNYFNNNILSSTLGLEGERLVNSQLNIHSNLINLKNIRLKDSLGRSCQCDNIILTRKGIFVVEVKNYGSLGNYSIKIDSTGRWSMKSGKTLTLMENPVEQNNRHIAILNTILKDINIDAAAHSIVTIANETVDIINESKEIVVRPSGIYTIIDTNFSSDNISKETLNKIQEYIIKNSLNDKKYPVFKLDKEFSDENIEKFNFLVEKAQSISSNLMKISNKNI